MRLRRAFMIASAFALAAALAIPLRRVNPSARDIALVGLSIPLIAYFTVRQVVIAVPRSPHSPVSSVTWDCDAVAIVPLVLFVPAPLGALVVVMTKGLTRRIASRGHEHPLITLHNPVTAGERRLLLASRDTRFFMRSLEHLDTARRPESESS